MTKKPRKQSCPLSPGAHFDLMYKLSRLKRYHVGLEYADVNNLFQNWTNTTVHNINTRFKNHVNIKLKESILRYILLCTHATATIVVSRFNVWKISCAELDIAKPDA